MAAFVCEPWQMDKKHIHRMALHDAHWEKDPEGVHGFFKDSGSWMLKTSVCSLCKCFVKKGNTKNARKEHGKTDRHKECYQWYQTYYHGELNKIKELRDTRERSYHLREARQRIEAISRWARVKDVMDWYHVPGDQAALKVALADLVFTRFVLAQPKLDIAAAVRKHVFYARAILCYRVAKSYLTERPGDAYTVGMLLVPYVTN
tara:strand:+ start:706 stop:1317 length:612 start_codon:yes stop_codon:yes gene_type:complete